jgi:hypothetical protein
MGENEPIVSHGRGGQGNIGADSTQYVDAGIVREGPYGDQGDGAYSAGRGGAGNIGSPNVRPTSRMPHDAEIIPELAIRKSTDETYHVGVGYRSCSWLYSRPVSLLSFGASGLERGGVL